MKRCFISSRRRLTSCLSDWSSDVCSSDLIAPRSLPQGAPTSPSITNALCLRLDARLSGLAKKLDCRYTRYADDMTFSWHGAAKSDIGNLIHAVSAIVKAEGFAIHPSKTRVMRSGARQSV